MPSIQVVKNVQAVVSAAAKSTVEDLRAAIATHGEAVWVLAGGTIPPRAAALIASDYADQLDWSKVIFVMGDERCVPLDDSDSSWLAYEQNLFSRLPGIPSNHLLRPRSDRPAEEAAELYETTLQGLSKNPDGDPRFAHVWLGMGDDGHTLSLFPLHESSKQTERLVIPVHHSPKPPADRISLTLRALAGTRACTVITTGRGKAETVERTLSGDTSLPIAQAIAAIEKTGGEVTWLLDAEAASLTRR